MSISSLLFTARDSLMSQQMAIEITGGNIANVDTPGYSRQRTDFTSVGSIGVKTTTAQIGVAIARVERIYDRYLESQIIQQQQNTGYGDALLRGLQNIEVMLDDTDGGGINDQLNKFWSAWENLSNAPGGRVERSTLLSAAQNLTSSLVSYRQNLDTINNDMNRNIADVVGQINSKVGEIRDLNVRIIETVGSSGEKNLLFDKRTEALKGLSELLNITHFEGADGTLSIYLANGDPLLQGVLAQPLSLALNTSNRTDITTATTTGETVNGALTRGKLGAYLELQNRIIPEYTAYIDDFATSLADRINALHAEGFDAYQNTGAAFFEIADGNNKAGTIRVTAAVAADVNRIAAAGSVSGDGENSRRIAAVQHELLMNNDTASLNSFLATVVGQIGSQVASAQTNSQHQALIMNQLDTQRASVSGVSIDEEMIRLIKYQMGYNAAGKLVAVVDEMMDTLLGLVKG
jgi:flagellar hook-associated protein 1